MAKKRGSAWDGLRNAYNLYQGQETLIALSRASSDTLWEIRNTAMMVAAIAAIGAIVFFLA